MARERIATGPWAHARSARHGKPSGVNFMVRDMLLILVTAVILSVGVKTFLIRSFYIPSGSMENTLQINDRIIVNELVPHIVPVQRGDVVVFEDPGGWLPPHHPAKAANALVAAVDWALAGVGLASPDSGNHLIKRVIGLPGDKVACCNAFGQMTVNGASLAEPYIDLGVGVTRVSKIDFSVTVPKGTLWVMGDNRYDSADSRYNRNTPSKGFVPISDVVGRAFVVSWPVARWSWLDDYPDVFAGVRTGGK